MRYHVNAGYIPDAQYVYGQQRMTYVFGRRGPVRQTVFQYYE